MLEKKIMHYENLYIEIMCMIIHILYIIVPKIIRFKNKIYKVCTNFNFYLHL